MKKISFFILLTAFWCNNINAQNVGIGESTPLQKLHIDGSSTAGLQTLRIEDCAVTTAGTNAGELATTTTTTNKAAYFDANGDLQARYVYGDNTQSLVLSGANQTITSTSLVDITGATINITPRHSTIYLSFAVSGYNPLPAGSPHSSWFVVGVSNGGSNVANFLNLSAETDDVGGSSGAATVTAGNFPLTVTPGVPVTIKLQGRRGGVASASGFTVDKTTYTSYMTIID